MLNLLGSFSAYSSKFIETTKIIDECNKNPRNILKTTGIVKVSKFNKNILIKDIYDFLIKKAVSDKLFSCDILSRLSTSPPGSTITHFLVSKQ